MKKKLVMVTLSLVMAISAITGCGKSDEEKARDEIMSHMDADEKANIAADQKEIEEWETEQQEKKEEAEAEQAALPDYSEDILTTYDIEWQTPLKATFVSEDYLDESQDEHYLISKVGDVSFSYINMDTNDTTSVSYAKSLAEENANDGFYQEFGNYILVGWDTGGNTENRIVITDSANNCTINFYIRTNNADIRKDVYDRNIQLLKEQLEAL